MVKLHAFSAKMIIPRQRAPVALALPRYLHPGVILRAVFVCDQACVDNLEICLQDDSGKNVALLLRYYFYHNHWSLNSQISEYWGVEEIKSSFPLRPEHSYTATVRVEEDSYIIHVNDMFISNYRHRLEYSLPTTMMILGPVYINYVTYEAPPEELMVMLGVSPEQEELNAKHDVLRVQSSNITPTQSRAPTTELSITRMAVTPGRINVLSSESTTTSAQANETRTSTSRGPPPGAGSEPNTEPQDLSEKKIKSVLKVSPSQMRLAETSVPPAAGTRSALKTALSERTLTQSRINVTGPNENTIEEPVDLDRSQIKKSVTFLGVSSQTDVTESSEIRSPTPESAAPSAVLSCFSMSEERRGEN